MSKFLKKYKVEIELLSPLFIGSGKEYYPNEYYFDLGNNQIFIIDFDKLFEECKQRKIDLGKAIKKEEFQTKITPFQGRKAKGFSIKKFIDAYSIPVEKVSLLKLQLKWDRKRGFKETLSGIRQFIKDGNGNYFIPGSSLKGCFRTLYLWKEISGFSERKREVLIKFNGGKIKFKNKAERYFQNQIEKQYNSLFQKFRVSDFYFENFQVSITQILRTARSQIPQFVEIIEKGKATGEIWIEKFGEIKEDDLEKLELENFKEISKELLFNLAKSKNQTAKEQMRLLEGKVSSLQDDEMIIRLGFGKGFDFSTVGDWIKETLGIDGVKMWFEKEKMKFSKQNIKSLKKSIFNFPLTYWKTFDGKPLGWVKLTFKQIP